MGIYDREYYRGETRGSAWLTGIAPACKTIIIINIIAFFVAPQLDHWFERWMGPRFVDNYLLASTDGIIGHGRVWELLTAAFFHADVFHILWNMVFLWFVGREMESMYGTRDFVAFYVMAAMLSTLGWTLISLLRHDEGVMLGASGAIMAVVVVYAIYYPRREVLLFFVIPVQMWLLVGLFLLHDLYVLLNPEARGAMSNMAVASHLTGAAYGYLFKRFDLRWSHLNWWRMRRPRLRIVMPEPREPLGSRQSTGSSWASDPATAPRPTTAAVVPEELLEAKLDEVLAKIAREGRSGLTEEENRVLQEASKRARNRRSDRL
jgi:membrane associated rhomboid family serine protease